MLKHMGYMVEYELPEECGHAGYKVRCNYKFNKKANKYKASMWLIHKEFDFMLELDSQYIEATKENVNGEVEKIISNAALSGYFEKAIQKYEFTYKCFDAGYELLVGDHTSV